MSPETAEAGALTVYSRPGCHLCEVLIEELQPLIRGRMALEVVDIGRSPELTERFGIRIPVVEWDGRFVCEYHLDRDAISTILDDLSDVSGQGGQSP